MKIQWIKAIQDVNNEIKQEEEDEDEEEAAGSDSTRNQTKVKSTYKKPKGLAI